MENYYYLKNTIFETGGVTKEFIATVVGLKQLLRSEVLSV